MREVIKIEIPETFDTAVAKYDEVSSATLGRNERNYYDVAFPNLVRFLNADFLPGWWWSVGHCSVSSDGSCGPARQWRDAYLLERREMDNGFHADLSDSHIFLALYAAAIDGYIAKTWPEQWKSWTDGEMAS